MRVLVLTFFFCCFACQSADSHDSNPTPTLLSENEMLAPAAAPTSALLTPFHLTDSIPLLTDAAVSPRAYFDIRSLEATSDNDKLNTTINTALGRAIAGDEAPMRVKDLPRTVRAFVSNEAKIYRQQEVDTALLNATMAPYEQELRTSTVVLYQTERFLTLETTQYYYAGGAHGIHYTDIHNFDLLSATRITFEDLFDTTDNAGLAVALRNASAVKNPDLLPTQNVGITAEGFIFKYPPYTISSNTDGEVDILLPYEVAKDYLSESALSLLGI